MTDYRRMYAVLCQGISKALDCVMATDNPIVALYLRNALEEAEEIYIETCGDPEDD